MKRFGIVPGCRIGIHGGEILVSEEGDTKRAIGFYADTIHIAARMEQKAKELGGRHDHLRRSGERAGGPQRAADQNCPRNRARDFTPHRHVRTGGRHKHREKVRAHLMHADAHGEATRCRC